MFSKYDSIQREILDAKKSIRDTEDKIARIVAIGTVQDKVKGGLGGEQSYKIEGFPQKLYDEQLKLLRNKKHRLLEKESMLLEYTEFIETTIDEIEDYRDRQILRRVFLENKIQQEVADELFIDRSLVSKIISKYL